MKIIKRQKSWIRTWDKQLKLLNLIDEEESSYVTNITIDFANGFLDAAIYGTYIMRLQNAASLSLNPSMIGHIDGFNIYESTPFKEPWQLDLPFPVPPKKFQRAEKPWYRRF